MANTTGTMNKSGSSCTLSVGSVTLNYGETLTITIGSGFPAGTEITEVQFYDVANGRKGPNHKGSWLRAGGGTAPAGVSIAASGTGFVITDNDQSNSDEDYYYDVKAVDPSRNSYDADPELVIRRKSNTGSARMRPAPGPAPEA